MLNAATIRKITHLGLLLLVALADNVWAGTVNVTADNKTGWVTVRASVSTMQTVAGCDDYVMLLESKNSATAVGLNTYYSSTDWAGYRDSGTYQYSYKKYPSIKVQNEAQMRQDCSLDYSKYETGDSAPIIVDRANANTFGALKPLVSLQSPVAGTQLQAGTPYTLKASAASLDLSGAGAGIASVVVNYAGAKYPMVKWTPKSRQIFTQFKIYPSHSIAAGRRCPG